MTRSGGRTGVTGSSGSDVVINIRANIVQASKKLQEAKKHMNGLERVSKKSLKGVAQAQQKVYNETIKLNKALGRSPFPAWALSVMFFGMALQRTFNRIWSSSTRAFQEVMDSVEGTVTQFTVLQGTTKWLGFVVGQALEPIAGWLIPIIERVADWVENNQTLTRGLVVTVGAVGALALTVGFAVTSVKGIIDAFVTLRNALVTLNLANIALRFNAITTAISAAAVASKAFLVVWGPIIAIGAAIVGVGSLIISMMRQMGGFFEFLKSVVRGVLRIINIVTAGTRGLVMEIWNGIKWVYNQILEGLEWTMNQATVIINKVVNGINRVFGTSIGNLNEINLTGAMAEVDKFGSSFIGTYSDMMGKYLEWEQRVLSPKMGYMDGFKDPRDMGLGGGAATESSHTTVYNQNQVEINLPSGFTEQELDRILQKYLQTQ